MNFLKKTSITISLIFVAISCSNKFDPLPPTLTFEEQLEADVERIDAYLAANDITAVEHESGIRYVMLVTGTGAAPTVTDDVKVKYEGRLFSGNVFDSNDTGITFNLTQLIEAWRITVPLLNEGGKMTVYAPSGYCYGTFGSGSTIGPNANLIFDIELIEIVE
jgi:FKBP-type peptidyl-prolyl cis-trans isomerase